MFGSSSIFSSILGLALIPYLTIFNFSKITTESINNLLGFSIGGLKFLKEYSEYPSKQVYDTTPNDQEEFDFIIVGAGSAGAALAARLTEISDIRILVIEAGEKENLLDAIPLLCTFLTLFDDIIWHYENPMKNFCLGYENKQCGLRTGKSLGGTSAVNYILATRGNKKNYDRWAEITGDESWSYNGMLKYFQKLETADVKSVQIDPKYRGFDGPVIITENRYKTDIIDAFIEAGREMGFAAPNDYNGQNQTGFSYLQTNLIHGERLSSNRAYLNPIKDRENLFVTMNSIATKILIDPKNRTAYGVEFMKNGETIVVKAMKEVILSAGALGTPKLLMLSGIGPAKHLESLNITVLQDAPVGENLMDHVTYPANFFFVNQTEGFIIKDLLNPTNPTVSEYLTERNGLFSTPGLVEGFAYINVDDPTPDNEDPNIEFLLSSGHVGTTPDVHRVFGIDERYFRETFEKTLDRYGYLIWPILMQPKSRGKTYLQSADPMTASIVDPNYFSDPDDMRIYIKAIRFAIKIAESNAMKKYGSERLIYTIPGCHSYKQDSDDFWECALRTYSQTYWHFSGTCKMGRANDTTAVVNPNLQVNNIKNLRIGDASIIPIIPTAHLNIPAMAIGEKLADMIKSYYKYDDSQ